MKFSTKLATTLLVTCTSAVCGAASSSAISFASSGSKPEAYAAQPRMTRSELGVGYIECKSFYNMYPAMVGVVDRSMPQDLKLSMKKLAGISRGYAEKLVGTEEVERQQVEIAKKIISEIATAIKGGPDSYLSYYDNQFAKCKALDSYMEKNQELLKSNTVERNQDHPPSEESRN